MMTPACSTCKVTLANYFGTNRGVLSVPDL